MVDVENKGAIIADLVAMDKEMIRLLDDLIHILIRKGYIKITDFSEEGQTKLLKRSGLRESI